MDLAPTVAAPRLYLGQFLLMAEDTSAAMPYFRRAAELEPQNVATHVAVADASLRMGRLEEAERAARRALAIQANSPTPSCCSRTHICSGRAGPEDLREARALLEQAVLAAPNDVLAHYNLGRAALRAGEPPAPPPPWSARWPDPAHLAARMNLAKALQRLGREKRRKRSFRSCSP